MIAPEPTVGKSLQRGKLGLINCAAAFRESTFR
jgi:hypothetical protein